MPCIPDINDKPPTLYSLLESIVNYGTDDKTKIKDLAKVGRTQIFDFDYPLYGGITKEEFECMILNKFLMRRIGYETLTAFKIALNVKLNEIMPTYNKLFESFQYWNIFNDGELETRSQEDTRLADTINTNETTNTLKNNSTTGETTISDRRNSELPQSEIQNVKDASYLTDYNYDTNTSNGTDESTSNGTSNMNGTTNVNEKGTLKEEIKRSPSDKIRIYTEFIEKKNNIYTMIFKDLDSLFYQLV